MKDEYERFISGGIAGITEVTLTHPLDLLKTRIQEAKLKNRPMLQPSQYLKHTYQLQGIQGLYKGYVPRFLGIVPMRFVFWGTQSNCNHYLSNNTTLNHKSVLILSGIIGGGAQTLIDNPIEAVKTQLMTSKKNISTVLKTRSFPGFYPTLYRNIGFATVFNYGLNNTPTDSVLINGSKAAVCGFIASVVTQPFDYIKTECQRAGGKSDTIWNITKKCILSDPRALMAGTIPRALLGFCNMGIGGTTICVIHKYLTNTF